MSAAHPQRLAPRDDVVRMLQAHGISPTEQRIRVGEIMFAAAQHLSAEQLLDGLRVAGARISKATVYNTLNLFAACGLVRQVNVDSTRACFDSNTALHYHFHNLDTGELIDVGVPEVEFRRLPDLPHGTELAGVDVVIRVRRKA